MKSFLLFVVQKTFSLIPDTKGFGYKRWALRLCGAKIGKNVKVCSSVRIIGDAPLFIGDNTWVGHGTWLFCSAPIRIGANVNIAPLCYIGTGTHIVNIEGASVAGKGVSKSIEIGDGAWIGARSSILAGVTIGEKAILAAGALANANVTDKCLFGGVPAKMIKKMDE